jgi:hypothetical protein
MTSLGCASNQSRISSSILEIWKMEMCNAITTAFGFVEANLERYFLVLPTAETLALFKQKNLYFRTKVFL